MMSLLRSKIVQQIFCSKYTGWFILVSYSGFIIWAMWFESLTIGTIIKLIVTGIIGVPIGWQLIRNTPEVKENDNQEL